MSNIYEDGTYSAKNPSWDVEDSPWKAQQIEDIILRNNINPKRVGEVGCGAGGILEWLATRTFGEDKQFIGYDISPQAIALCKDKERDNLSFKLEDLCKTPSSHVAADLDLVMAVDVFEHVEDYIGFLRQLKGCARYKIFHIPLDLSVQTVLRAGPILRGREQVGHLHYFTAETAIATLHDTGYTVIDQCFTGGSVDLPNRGWRANCLRYPRRAFFALNQSLTVRLLGGYSLLVLAK